MFAHEKGGGPESPAPGPPVAVVEEIRRRRIRKRPPRVVGRNARRGGEGRGGGSLRLMFDAWQAGRVEFENGARVAVGAALYVEPLVEGAHDKAFLGPLGVERGVCVLL